MSRVVIYGAGGFGRELVTAARGGEVAFLSDTPVAAFAGLPVIRLSDVRADDEVVIAVADWEARRKLSQRLARFGILKAPTAIIGHEVEIGEGSVFCDHTMVTASARIGRHFHCNIYSYVAHDCVIGDFVTFAPRVCCNGNIHIGDGAYIGTGATLKQGNSAKPLIIGEGAVIGMGAVVTKDVPPGAVMVGNPARELVRPLRSDSSAVRARG